MIKGNTEGSSLIRHMTLRVDLGRRSAQQFADEIVSESQVSLYINGSYYSAMTILPFEIKELVVGHLTVEGIIEKIDDILELEISKQRIDIQLRKELPMRKTRIISTECGSEERSIPPRIWMKPKKQDSTIRLVSQVIIEAVKNLNLSAEIYRRTGGTHSAALMNKQGCIMLISEDISRHSAVDKVIGKAILQGLNFKEVFLTSSGRITSDIVIKAANVGIPIIVSVSAPTDKGIKLADMMRITLIGFARGKRFNIYTHPEKIIF